MYSGGLGGETFISNFLTRTTSSPHRVEHVVRVRKLMSPRVPSYWGLNRWNQGKLRHLRWSPGDADPGLHSRRTSKPRGAASVSTATRTALRRTLRERQRGCCTGRGGPPLRRRWRRRRPPTRVENGVSTSRLSTFLPTDPRGITLGIIVRVTFTISPRRGPAPLYPEALLLYPLSALTCFLSTSLVVQRFLSFF